MSMERRNFLKLAGISALLGIGGASVAGLGRKGAEASQMEPGPNALTAKRWGFVVDMSKFRTQADIDRVVHACHSIHNVPDFGKDSPHEVKWIWTDAYEHVFPGNEDEYTPHTLKEMPFLVFCNHCAKPACVRVCPTKATFKRKDGIVMMDMHRCIGCRFCMAACPFGARSFNFRDPRPGIREPSPEFPTRTKGVVEKCTACYERLAVGKMPACAEQSNGGIVFGDLEDPHSEVRKLIASHYTIRRKPELGTMPSIYYIIRSNGTGGAEHA
ncbi:MAG: 4Fe-4S dicluster domain-containing protein [Nitrospirales bacterium]|nr:4Fe-4S dicluster domain-containing protein [Nitrospirales bacterium]